MTYPSALPEFFYVNRTDRGRLRLTGRDRQAFLQGMVSNDVARLAPGEGCYTFQLDATGHVLADARVLVREDQVILDVEPGLAPQVAATLERYLVMERCKIADITDETAQVFIGGANAATLLRSHFGSDGAETWTEGQHQAVASDAFVAATRLTTAPGFDLYCPAGRLPEILALLESHGAKPIDPDVLEALRIEAGIPRFGFDIDARVLALETGQQARAVSFKKGCYIGQEIVARIDARGHTNRTFAGFRLAEGAALPAPATAIHAEDGREIGRITSSTLAPTLGFPVALGYIRHDSAEPGTKVTIGGQSAVVAALPFGEVGKT